MASNVCTDLSDAPTDRPMAADLWHFVFTWEPEKSLCGLQMTGDLAKRDAVGPVDMDDCVVCLDIARTLMPWVERPPWESPDAS